MAVACGWGSRRATRRRPPTSPVWCRRSTTPAVGATVDVGHVRGCVPRERWGTPAGVEELNQHIAYLLQTLGEKVVHFHIHDVRRADFRDHRGLGDAATNGVIDFPRLMTQVTGSGYAGLWILELEEPDREAALRRSRDFLAATMRGRL